MSYYAVERQFISYHLYMIVLLSPHTGIISLLNFCNLLGKNLFFFFFKYWVYVFISFVFFLFVNCIFFSFVQLSIRFVHPFLNNIRLHCRYFSSIPLFYYLFFFGHRRVLDFYVVKFISNLFYAFRVKLPCF